jgi:hypothetical protein
VLVAQLEELRAHTLKEEAAARAREAEELRLAEGAFPALFSGEGGGGGGGAPARGGGGGAGGGHRVLSVDSRTKRIRVESYSGASRSGLESEEEEAEAGVEGASTPAQRVPPPPWEVEYVRVQRGPATRWVDLKGGGTVRYVTLTEAA